MPNIVWIWLAALVIFLILELMTPTLIFGCFVVGSLVAGLYGYFSPESYYVQIGLFIAVSVILIPLTRTLAKKITKEPPSKSNVDALIGKVGLVTKAIDPDLGGQVKIEGEVWGALANEAIGPNDKVTVISVQGTRLLVQKKI
ncbi:MAG TPA: NfeD family protein [candidate division Zixibacteria bacterium]|nr:NfeD family protein [candidate division Zixibacteria bacterium]